MTVSPRITSPYVTHLPADLRAVGQVPRRGPVARVLVSQRSSVQLANPIFMQSQAGYIWLLEHCAPLSGGGRVSALSYTAPMPSAVLGARQRAPADVAATPGLGVSTTGMGPTSAEPRSARRALSRRCDGLLCAPFKQVPPVCGHPGRSSPPPWACMWAMPPPSHPNPSSGVRACPTASHRHTPWSPCHPRCQGSNRRPCAAPPSQLLRRPCIPYLS